MNGQGASVASSLLFLCTPIVFIPVIIGFYVIYRKRGDALSQFAGLLTLKPLLATPIWASLIKSPQESTTGSVLSTLIPGVGLTLLLLVFFSPLLLDSATRSAAWRLLALDCLRWLSSFGVVIQAAYYRSFPASSNVVCITMLLAIAMPAVFAFAALTITSRDREKRKNDWDEKPKNAEL
jgi:hypothetical protein